MRTVRPITRSGPFTQAIAHVTPTIVKTTINTFAINPYELLGGQIPFSIAEHQGPALRLCDLYSGAISSNSLQSPGRGPICSTPLFGARN